MQRLAEMPRKRRIALVSAAVLFALMVGLTGILGRPDAGASRRWEERFLQGRGDAKVAVINVMGEITSARGDGVAPAGEASSDDLVSQLRQAEEDDQVEAVILRLNTPGGSVVASDEIHQQVERLRRAGTPVVASMSEVAASGGYFIATAADRIVANPSTITGSIGVIMVLLNVEEAAGKLGVEPVVIKAGRLKDIGSPFAEMTREERAILQRLIDQAHDRFVEVVAEGRPLAEREVRRIADGRPLSGRQARQRNLVDELGDLDAAVEAAKELADLDEARVVEYQRPFSLLERLGRGWPGIRGPLEEAEGSLHVTGPVLKYLYLL